MAPLKTRLSRPGSVRLLYGEEVWPRITKLAENAGRSYVAVAYFGSDASKMLPLKRGDLLVVDMSDAAVKAGQTKPAELVKLIKRGVEVRSFEGLHAKVYVLGNSAVVGSANVSQSSAGRLMESIVETRDAALVKAARRFVLDLQSVEVGERFARLKQRLYQPPRGGGGGKPSSAPTIWRVHLSSKELDEIEERQERAGCAAAKTKIRDESEFKLDEFVTWGGRFYRDVKVGDEIVQRYTRPDGLTYIYPPGRVLRCKRFKGSDRMEIVVHVELPRRPAIHVDQARSLLGRYRYVLGRPSSGDVLIRGRAAKAALLGLWKRSDR